MAEKLSFEEWIAQGRPSGGKKIGKDPYLEYRSVEEVEAEIKQIQDFSVRAESFLQSVNELTSGKDYYIPSDELIATGKALANEAPTMLRMYNANSRFMAGADTNSEAFASSIGMIGDIASALEEDKEYFSQFADEEDFKLKNNEEEQMRNYYKSYDIEKGAQEVAAIKNGMDASNLARTELVNMEKDLARDHNGEFDWEASAAKVEFSGLSAHQIRKLYEKHLMAYNEMDAGEYYDIYEKALKEHEARVFKKKSYEYQDFLRVDGFQEKANAGRATADGEIEGDYTSELYGYEKDIYFYLLNEKGEDEAKKYVEFLKPSLKERRGETIGREINDIDNHALRWIVANSYAGITNTIGAFRDIAEVFVNFDTPAVHEHANDYIRRNARNGFERVSLDISATTGAMVPAVAAGIATGGTAWGPIAVNIMQGLQASGSKEREMVAAGYTRREAQNAGLLVGIGEATIGSVLDTTFGATGIPGAIEKKIDNISSAYGKASAKFLSHVGGEIVEEEAMLFLEPYIQSLVTGEEYTVPEMEEILYTALVTALSTGVIDIVAGQTFSGAIDQTRKTRAVGQQLISSDASSAVKALGLKSDNVGIQNLAKKINDAPMGRRQEIRTGSLYERLVAAENSKTAISDRADIRKRLQDKETLGDKSFDAETAGDIADAVVAARNGQEMSADQRKVLKKYGNDSRVEKVVDSLWGAGEAKLGQKTPVADIYRTAVKTNKLKALGLSDDAAKKMASGDTEGALKSMALSTGRVSVKSVGTDGTVTINGKTTSVADADFKSEFQRNAYSAVMGAKNMTPEAANLILGVRANMNGRDIEAALKVYQRGVAGEPIGDVNTTLSKAHIEAIHKAGMRVHSEGVYTAEQKVKNIYDRAAKALEKSGEKVTGSLMADEGVDISKLTGTEKRVADLAAEIAPSLSVDIALYRDNDSQATGFYDYESDTIYLNVASKVDLTTREGKETAMAFTLGHELLHRARVGTPKGYDSFVKFLLSEYGKAGMDVEEMIGEQIALSNAHDETLPEAKRVNMTREMAIEEIAAEACSRMLIDTDAGKKLAAWGQQSKANADFLQKLKQMLNKLINRLRTALNGADPGSEAAKAFMQLDKKVQQILSDMFVDMSKTAAERISTIKSVDEKFAKDFLKTRDIAYNLAAQETHKESLQKKFDAKNASVDIETLKNRYDKILKIWEDIGIELNSKFLNEWNSKVGTDQAFSVFKAQSGYKYNIELSTMCKKGVALFEAIDTIVKNEVMKELDMKVMGKAEKEILYDILKTDFEIPCAICYVEQARQREGVIIDAFLNGKDTKLGWNSVLDSIEAGMRERGVNYRFESVSRDIATDKYTAADLTMDEKTQDAFFAALMDVANKEIQRYNKAEGKSRKLIKAPTKDGIWDGLKGNVPSNLKIFKVLAMNDGSRFRMDADLLYSSRTTVNLASAHSELYSLFNSQGGVSGYKTKQTPVVYWGDLLDKGWKSSTVRDAGAIRNQSNSDSQMYTMLDQVQMYIDLTAKGYYLQAYTKVISELKLLGLSKAKINASLIPKVVVYYNSDGTVDMKRTQENAGLNEKGEPIFDDIEGIDHNEAFMLISDPGYSRSVGGVCIGYSDNHIEALLADPRIQMVIGFHDKTNDPDKRYRGARYSKNYNGLNEAKKLKADGKYETVHVNFTAFLKQAEKKFHWDDATESYVGTIQYKGKTYNADDIPKLAADLYLEKYNVVNDKGERTFIPAYDAFKDNPNYYKLLADFSLYDSHGHYSPMQKVEYNMPDTVPYLDANGNKQTMKTEEYIKAELEKEMATRDALSLKLADDSDDGIIPRFKKALAESGRKSYRISAQQDADYMAAVESGDKVTQQRMVNEAAKEAGAIMLPNGRRPLDLYRGTANFGRTIFKSPVIFTTTSPSVSAGYGGGKGYARQRLISESYTPDDGTTKTLIRNAKNVLGRDLEPYSKAKQNEIRKNMKTLSDEISQKANDVWTTDAVDALPDMDEAIDNSLAWVLSLPGSISENIDDFGTYVPVSELESWVNKFDEHLPKLREYLDSHRDELKGTAAWQMFELVMGYELSDFAIDARYKLLRSFDNDLLVSESGSLVSADTVREQIETLKNVGSYHLYGFAGSKPLVIDGNGSVWHGIYVERWGGYFTTDGIVKKAQEEGYTSVCIKNINDVAMNNYSANVKSDIYAFFDREQVKSADPVTYDDDGNVIPLSERFNDKRSDIRYRLASSPDLSPRTLLTDPNLEGKNQAQKLNLERYRDAIKKADELEGHLNDMEAQYAEYTKEQKKHKMGQELRAEINKTKNRLNMANEDVRKLEQSPPLQTILKNKRSEIFQETAKTAENAESMTVSKEGLEIIENEFTRLAREADSIGDLKAKLKAEAKRHRSDNALWEQRFNKLLREYEASRRINESDRKIIEDEFKRLVEEYEKASADIDDKDAKIERLEYVLEKEAKKHHDDNEMWRQEFKRLLRAYERADRKIDNMKESFKEKEKARVEKNNKNAVKKSIQTKIRDLRKLFARGKDDRNVKSGMRDLVSTTLATADMLFNDSYTEEDMIRNGVSVAISEVDSKLLNRANDILRELESPPATIDAKNLDEFDDVDKLSEWYAETEPKLKRELNQIKHKLEHVFKAERNAIDGMTVSTLMDSLRDAYMELKNSGEEYIRAAYNADNLEMFNSIITNFGSSRIVDMSLSELETLNKVYGIVLGSVRQANKYFAKGKKATIAEKAKLILEDFKAHKPSGGEIKIVAKHISGKMGWNYEKVYYALKRIDSKTFTEMYKDLMRSEDTAQRDMIEALEFRDRLVAKYGYNSWAVNKKMDQVFLDSSGKKFQLTLGEAMSLYAYGRRKSALNNLKNGGFEFAETLLKDPDPATTYKIDEKQFEAIESALTEDQKAFARDMQKYLADVMGAKGNEVSQELYGIDLFTDPYYFPVHIAADYRANVRESTAKKEAGFASQKNAGFTYVKNENAVAPIMLESFLDTWSYHVNEMSRYHASVLPLENIRKVMNYGATDTDLSITAQMKNSYGDAAFDYFNNLYREANSGAITDKLQEKPKKLLSKFRKGSVMYKLSVWFQQPGSITRAEALVDRRYFRGPLGIGRLPIGFTEAVLNRWLGKHNNTYEKMLKYAPGVTMTKELGGFDTATGTSMLAALKDTKKTLWQNIKSGTGKEIAGSVMNLVDDNFIANIPNKMDKVAWIAIWQACENEQKAKHKGMDYNGDAFLELVGERFTEVIQATQVYDSIFAKSPMLKSKNLAVQYLVSFMNEPNTVANMAEDVVRSVSKGKWKDAYKSASAIIRSTILTNALAAFAYAMGDDDEDEKYWESYASHFVSGVVEDANPLSYIPGGKDVYSLTQGYDQERPDMSAWADVVNSIIKERTLSNKDTSEMTDEELEAHEKEQRKASWDLVFTIGNLVGIPVGNIRKEATAIINQIGSKMDDPVSWGAMKSSIEKELWSTIPKWWRPEDSKTDDLYWAIMEGDTTYVERLKKQYKDDDGNFDPDKYDNALKKALQENDPRIKEAAQARLDHDLVTYGKIYNDMVAEGKFTDVVILKAITAEFNKINPDEEKEKNEDPMLDVYGAEEYYFATLYNAENKDEIYDHLIDNKIADGMTEYKANQSVMTSIANELRDNDVRIEEAATAYLADNYAEYSRIYDEILAEGNFSDEIVSKAVRSKINQLKPDEPTEPKDPDSYKSRFTADDYYKAIMGKSESVDDIYNDLYQNAIADGKSDNEATKSVTSSIATALRNNDPRVNEAAVAHLDGNVKKRVELINAMVKDGFSQNAVVAAVDGEINKLSPNNSADTAPKQKGLYRAEDVATSVIAGDSTTASKAFNDLVATNKANGKSPKEAKSAAQSSVKTALRDAYESGDLNKTKAVKSLETYCGMSEDDAKADVIEWDYKKKNPSKDVESGWFDTYVDKVSSSGMPIETYVSYRSKIKGIEGEDKKDRICKVIDSMDISDAQKDALYFANGWASSSKPDWS